MVQSQLRIYSGLPVKGNFFLNDRRDLTKCKAEMTGKMREEVTADGRDNCISRSRKQMTGACPMGAQA